MTQEKSGLKISWEAFKFGFGILIIIVGGLMTYAYLNGSISYRLDDLQRRLGDVEKGLSDLRRGL